MECAKQGLSMASDETDIIHRNLEGLVIAIYPVRRQVG